MGRQEHNDRDLQDSREELFRKAQEQIGFAADKNKNTDTGNCVPVIEGSILVHPSSKKICLWVDLNNKCYFYIG